jgi:hypothetical protein
MTIKTESHVIGTYHFAKKRPLHISNKINFAEKDDNALSKDVWSDRGM